MMSRHLQNTGESLTTINKLLLQSSINLRACQCHCYQGIAKWLNGEGLTIRNLTIQFRSTCSEVEIITEAADVDKRYDSTTKCRTCCSIELRISDDISQRRFASLVKISGNVRSDCPNYAVRIAGITDAVTVAILFKRLSLILTSCQTD
jgi:hypothetical protein